MASEIDIREFAKLIRAKRGRRGLRAVADEIEGVSTSTLSRIEQGKVPDLDTFIRLCKWLGVSADRFTITTEPVTHENERTTPEIVSAHLRADRTLDPQTAEALVTMIQIAFAAVDNGKIGKPKRKHAARVQNVD